jgi:hypothetical protein
MPTREIFDQGSTYKVTGSYDLSAPTIQVVTAPVSGFPIWIDAGFPPVRWNKIEIINAVKPNVYYQEFKEKKPDVAKEIENLDAVDTKPVNIFDIKPVTNAVTRSVEAISKSANSTFNKILIAGGIIAVILLVKK